MHKNVLSENCYKSSSKSGLGMEVFHRVSCSSPCVPDNKLLSSAAIVSDVAYVDTASITGPTTYDFGTKTDGLYYQNSVYYSAKYNSGTYSYDNQNIPGFF